LLTRH
jgi:hypothetical protein